MTCVDLPIYAQGVEVHVTKGEHRDVPVVSFFFCEHKKHKKILVTSVGLKVKQGKQLNI